MKGTDDQFDVILKELAKNNKQFESLVIKHMTWVERSEYIYQNYGWDKKEIFKEIRVRLGEKTDDLPPISKKKRSYTKKSSR